MLIPDSLATWAIVNAGVDTWHSEAAELVLALPDASDDEAELLLASLLEWAEHSDGYDATEAAMADLVWQLGVTVSA